jgi:adenylate kinase
MIILLMGPQGSGKGTEGKLLSKALQLPLIGVGELLRQTSPSHPKYELISEQLRKGDLVDYATTAAVIRQRISQPDCANGYILDGWSRILEQNSHFDPNPDIVLYFSAPIEVTMRRILDRRVCETTGEILNIRTSSPQDLERCKDHLVMRSDDTEETVLKRQHKFDTETVPVLDMYRKQGKVIEIDGVGSADEVHGRVLKALEIRQSKT